MSWLSRDILIGSINAKGFNQCHRQAENDPHVFRLYARQEAIHNTVVHQRFANLTLILGQ